MSSTSGFLTSSHASCCGIGIPHPPPRNITHEIIVIILKKKEENRDGRQVVLHPNPDPDPDPTVDLCFAHPRANTNRTIPCDRNTTAIVHTDVPVHWPHARHGMTQIYTTILYCNIQLLSFLFTTSIIIITTSTNCYKYTITKINKRKIISLIVVVLLNTTIITTLLNLITTTWSTWKPMNAQKCCTQRT